MIKNQKKKEPKKVRKKRENVILMTENSTNDLNY